MNDVQNRLAELLKAGVEDPPGRVTVKAVRHQRARRRTVAGAGVVTAVAIVVAVSAGLAGQLGKTGAAVRSTVSAAPVPCRPGWSAAAGAVPAGDRRDALVAIAGSASDDIWAVGDRLPNLRHVFPLLEHWDGRRWASSAGASLGGRQAYLTSVAATASGDVWAVGNFASVGPRPPAPLIEHWNGRSWSLQPTDALKRLKSALPYTVTSVTALAPDNVWVLGTPGSNSTDVYLHWNGTSWQIFRGPHLISPSRGTAAMQTIASDRRGHLWAVGGWMRGQSEAGAPGGGTVERWTDHRWAVDRHATWKKPLTMVAPVAPDDVWAITGGSFTTAGSYGISPVQVLHWNGSTWTVKLSRRGASSVPPAGLVAVSADDAYVMGVTTQRPSIDHWDGTRWRSVPLGRPGHLLGSGIFYGYSGQGLTLTSDGSIAALAAEGMTDRLNYLWLRCRH
jgi:hypothetical protein